MNKNDQDALQFVSEVLVQIRALAKLPPSPDRLQAIAEFADAMHNIPRVVAEGQSEQLAFLIEGGIKRGVETWKRAVPGGRPTSVQS